MNDHEFLSTIHDEFESNKSDRMKLNALLGRLETRFDISSHLLVDMLKRSQEPILGR